MIIFAPELHTKRTFDYDKRQFEETNLVIP